MEDAGSLLYDDKRIDSQIRAFVDLTCRRQGWNRVPNPKTIFDLGCREGYQSIEFATTFPDARVFAFECNPVAIKLARKNFKRHPNITLIEAAVSDRDGEISFFPVDPDKVPDKEHILDWLGFSSVHRFGSSHPEVAATVGEEIKVPAIQLGHWMNVNCVYPVDLLWMDIQGSELAALKGMGEMLKTVKAIWTEVTYESVYQNQVLFPELREFMESMDFVCVLNWPGVARGEGDALFFNKVDMVT